MNIKNVINRSGVIFILGPIFVICCLLDIIIAGLTIVWGPFYYIITGKDPIIEENFYFLRIANKIANWYFNKYDT